MSVLRTMLTRREHVHLEISTTDPRVSFPTAPEKDKPEKEPLKNYFWTGISGKRESEQGTLGKENIVNGKYEKEI